MTKRYLLNDGEKALKLYVTNSDEPNLINGGDFDAGGVEAFKKNWPDSDNLKDPGNGKVELVQFGYLGQDVPSQAVVYTGQEGDNLALSFEVSALYGSTLTVTIQDTEINDQPMDHYTTTTDGTFTLPVMLKRDVSKETPLHIKFTTSNTVQLDNIQFYVDVQECVSQDLINGGDFNAGGVEAFKKNWPDSDNLKDPGNGKVELVQFGYLGQDVPSQDVVYTGQEGDNLALSFEVSALYGSTLTVTIQDTEINDQPMDHYTATTDGTFTLPVMLKRDVSKETPLHIKFTTSNTAQLDNVKLLTCSLE